MSIQCLRFNHPQAKVIDSLLLEQGGRNDSCKQDALLWRISISHILTLLIT